MYYSWGKIVYVVEIGVPPNFEFQKQIIDRVDEGVISGYSNLEGVKDRDRRDRHVKPNSLEGKAH